MAKSPHELLGIAVAQLDQVNDNFDQAIMLLKAIKSGEVDIAKMTITDTGWEITDPDDGGGGEKAPAVVGKVGAGKAG